MARICDFCDNETAWARILLDERLLCPACERIEFIRAYCSLGGDYSDQTFEPLPWFRTALRDIYGPRDIHGQRIVEDVLFFLPKGSAKTTSLAALLISELCLAKTTGCELYSAATVKKQAALTYAAAAQMVNANKMLSARLKLIPSEKRIVRRDDLSSFYVALSSDGDAADGCAPQMVIRDEVHLWRTKSQRALFDVLEKSTKKRKSPIVIDISTAGEKDHSELMWNRYEKALKWLEDGPERRNPRFYAAVHQADQKRMDEDENYWSTYEARVEAHPAHEANGGYMKDKLFSDMVDEARGNGLLRASYCRYFLNYWGTNSESVINYPDWLKCGGGINMRDWPAYDPELAMHHWGLADNPCYLGMDIGATRDLTALAAIFPPHGDRTRWCFLVWYWMPARKVEERTLKDQVEYTDWVARGFIQAHKEARTNPLTVLPRIRWCMQMFQVRELAYDPWNANELIKRITTGDEKGNDAIDLECVEVKQDVPQLNIPTKWLIDASAPGSDLIWHGNNPVLNWNARNLGVKLDSNNNCKPNKVSDDDTKKIDGIAAVITGLRRGLLAEVQSVEVDIHSMG